MNWLDLVKLVVAAVGGFLSWMFGGWDMSVLVLVVFVCADYLTGIIAAGINRELSSAVGFRGIAKKLLIFVMVAIGAMLDRYLGQDFVRDAACTFYIANEGLSILENVGRAGVQYPAKLKAVIAALNKDDAADEAEKEE